MRKITLDDILDLGPYEKVRDSFRRRIIDHKRNRRVAVGDCITLVFEDYDTMLFQTQEMLRAERIVDEQHIREEIEVYNELIPDRGELSATLLIEITDSERIRQQLVELIGIDDCVHLMIGDRHRVPAVFEGGRSKEDKLSAVQYVRFPFEAAAVTDFVGGQLPVKLAIDHPRYRHEAPIEGAVRDSLAADLQAE